MVTHLKYIDGVSDKFWQIEQNGISYTITYGRNGTSGVSVTKTMESELDCNKTVEKLIYEKTKKGYSESGEVVISKVDNPKSKAKNKLEDKFPLEEVIKEYNEIIKSQKIDLLIPFLIEKTKGNLVGFKKHVKFCKKYWIDYQDLSKDTHFINRLTNGSSWGIRATPVQSKIIELTCLAIYDKSEINSNWQIISLISNIREDKFVEEIMFWIRPTWLEAVLVDRIRRNEWFTLDYYTLRYYEDNGFINFNPEVFSFCLSNANFHRAKFTPREFIKKITEDERAYSRDIPSIMDYELSINWQSFRDDESQIYDEFNLWEIVISQLLVENKIARKLVIEKALEIQNRDWNNNIKTFYKNLLTTINTTDIEFLEYQNIIFKFLQNSYVPIVNYGLDLCKKIAKLDKFALAEFIEWLEPIMMREDCKTGVKKIIPYLESLAVDYPKFKKKIALILADSFMISDLQLQEKVAKTILKLYPKKDKDLSEKINIYLSNLVGNVKSTLSIYFNNQDLDIKPSYEKYKYSPVQRSRLIKAIKTPQTWNEILFQFGKFISSKETLEGEILLDAFIRNRETFPHDYLEQLEPYYKQLHTTYLPGIWKNYIGNFFLNHLKGQQVNPSNLSKSCKFKTLSTASEYILIVQNQINAKSNLPMLSFPTHEPYWVEPKVLLERIIEYQNKNVQIYTQDLVIALCRMPRENIDQAVTLVDQIQPNLKPLLEYALGVHTNVLLQQKSILGKFAHLIKLTSEESKLDGVWAATARTFYPESVFEEFKSSTVSSSPNVIQPYREPLYFKEEWNEWKHWQTNETERTPSWYEVGVKLPSERSENKNLIYSLDIFKFDKNKWEYEPNEAENVNYWISVSPQNQDALSLKILISTCKVSFGNKEELKEFLRIVNRPEFRFSYYSTYLFAASFFVEAKDVRMMSSEVLYELINNMSVPLDQLSKSMIIFIENKYGSFSRLVDCLVSLKDSSPLHNQALFQIIDTILALLPPKFKLPIQFKKFIEILYDVSIKTQSKLSIDACSFLTQYKDNANLKKLISELTK